MHKVEICLREDYSTRAWYSQRLEGHRSVYLKLTFHCHLYQLALVTGQLLSQ